MLPPNVQMSHSRAREHVTRDIYCRIYIVTRLCTYAAPSIYICHRRMRQEHELSPNASLCPPVAALSLHWGPNRCTSSPRLPAPLPAGAGAHRVMHAQDPPAPAIAQCALCAILNTNIALSIIVNCELNKLTNYQLSNNLFYNIYHSS